MNDYEKLATQDQSSKDLKDVLTNLSMYQLPNMTPTTNKILMERAKSLATNFWRAFERQMSKKMRRQDFVQDINRMHLGLNAGQQIPEQIENQDSEEKKNPEEEQKIERVKQNLNFIDKIEPNSRYGFAKSNFLLYPKKTSFTLMSIIEYIPEAENRKNLIRLALTEGDIPDVIFGLQYILDSNPPLDDNEKVEIFKLVLELSPDGLISTIISSLIRYLPIKSRFEIIKLCFNKNPFEASKSYAFIVGRISDNDLIEIAKLAIESNPEKVIPIFLQFLQHIPENSRENLVRLALNLNPKTSLAELIRWYDFFDKPHPEYSNEFMTEIRAKYEGIIHEERKKIEESERMNPIFYKEIEELEKKISRREFAKTGSRTIVLGGGLKGKVVLRIIRDWAFASWVKAFSAVGEWKNAGFDYVPIEPIFKANLSVDKKNVRAYTGVLGIDLSNYLEMLSSIKFSNKLTQQMIKIAEVLSKLGIEHGHTHMHNFCILHERNNEGEIEWSRPPRIYCIDFDRALYNEFLKEE